MTNCTRSLLAAALLPLFAACSGGLATRPSAPPPPAPRAAVATPAVNDARKGDPDQRFNAALKLMKDHQPQEAQAAFLALSKDYPNLSGPLTDLGILYAQGRQRPQAIAGLARAVTANPRNAVAWNWLGSLYREGSDYPHAEQAYRQALAAQPDYASAHLNLGLLSEQFLHRPQDALAQYREYLRCAGKEDLIVTAWIKELEATTATRVASGATP